MSESSVFMTLDYKCVTSHRQGVSERLYKNNPPMCDNTRMAKQAFPIEAVRSSIRRMMDENGDRPKPLAAELRLSETGIRDIFLEKTKSVGGPKLDAIAQHYGVTIDEILSGTATTQGRDGLPPSNASKPIAYEGSSMRRMDRSLPVYGAAIGAEQLIDGEAVELTTLNRAEVIEHRERPPILNGKRDVYGLYVQGSSMDPAFDDGDLLVVQKTTAISVGDFVVVYIRPKGEHDDGETAENVLIKRLVRRTAQYIELRQYQPDIIFRIPTGDVLRIDKALRTKDLLS